MKEKNWSELYIPNNRGERLFCKHHLHNRKAPNVLYIHTPLGSVDSFMSKCYIPLANYEINIFAIDPSGVGNSEGDPKTFSLDQLIQDLDSCIDFIYKEYSDDVHLFGGTGIGGILGQYYAGSTEKLISFVQYGVGIYKDMSLMPYPTWLLKGVYLLLKGLVKWLPSLRITFPVPEYNGYNTEKDNSFYEELLVEYPKALVQPLPMLTAMFDMFLAKKSFLSSRPKCPTLVFKMCHDRYFPENYFQKYFKDLKGKKKLYTIDDTHCSFYFRAEEVCHEAAGWIKTHSNIKAEEKHAQI